MSEEASLIAGSYCQKHILVLDYLGVTVGDFLQHFMGDKLNAKFYGITSLIEKVLEDCKFLRGKLFPLLNGPASQSYTNPRVLQFKFSP